MSFPRYGSYKDSGVEWLGEVPSHWPPTRLRYVAKTNPSKTELSGADRSQEVSFLPMDAIGEDGSLRLTETRAISEVETGYTYFRDGDVVVAKITPCFENGKGTIMRGLQGGVGFGTTELIVARPKGQNSATFLHWLFCSPLFRLRGEASMYGAGGQKRVPDDFVRDFLIGLPPPSEQAAIAAFLDRETAKIDALVEEQRRLIALLAEKRQAVISHAVTKGLDPTVPMKDSGVEWLGEVPAHWEVKRLKYLAVDGDGIQLGPFGGMLLDLDDEDTGYKLYGQENTISGDFTAGHRWLSEKRYVDLARYSLLDGDIVLTRKGSLGNARFVVELSCPGIIDSDTIRIRVDHNLVIPLFITLLLHESDYISYQIALMKRGAILSGLNSETVANIVIFAPPKTEQILILEALSQRCANSDQLISSGEAAITLLQERRAALISAAVTGKIDVRGLVPAVEEAA